MSRPGRLSRSLAGAASGVASLLVLAVVSPGGHSAPVNDLFSQAIPLTGLGNFPGSNAGGTAESREPAHAGELARSSVWWRWTAPPNASYSITTSNSTFDTVLAVYTGSALSNLVLVAANDDVDLGILYDRVVFRAFAGETFHVAVDGVGGATGTIQLGIGNIARTMVPWTAERTDGSTFYSSNYAGKVILIDLWETICVACVEELPDLVDLHDAYSPRGFTIVGLAADPDPQVVDSFLSGKGVRYPIAMNNPAAEQAVGGLISMPTKYLVDQESRIVGSWIGGHTLGFYENIVLPLLRQPTLARAEIARAGTNILISWLGSPGDYEVEGSSQLVPGSWIKVEAPVQSANGRSVMILPADGLARFFRLKKL